jgi:hypothetical protein
MEGRRPFLRRLLHRLLAPRPEAAARHPTPEALSAYDADELPAEQDDAIQEHFLRCRECPELLLDLQEFAEPERAAPDLPDSLVATAWQALRARLGDEPWRSRLLRWLSTSRFAYALSAALLATAAVLALWVSFLRGDLRRLEAPQANVPVVELALETRGGAKPTRITLPAERERFLLVLASNADASLKDYRIKIVTPSEREIWSQDGLTRAEDGSFSLALSRRFLPAGQYLIRIIGGAGGRARTLEEYPILLSFR